MAYVQDPETGYWYDDGTSSVGNPWDLPGSSDAAPPPAQSPAAATPFGDRTTFDAEMQRRAQLGATRPTLTKDQLADLWGLAGGGQETDEQFLYQKAGAYLGSDDWWASHGAPAGTGSGTTRSPATTGPGGGTTPGYDPNTLRAALMAYNVPASASALAQFIAAHPEFATGVTIGGSKKNKLYGPGGEYLADVIRGTSGSNPSWDWDTATGERGVVQEAAAPQVGSLSQLGTAIDPSYLEAFNEPFAAPGGATPPTWTPPPAFEYQDFEGFDPWTPTSASDVYADPSFAFRRDEGKGLIEASAASRGLINSGGTLKDLLKYGQEFASQEYGNIDTRRFNAWDRGNQNKFTTYDTNRNNAASNYMTNYGVNRDTFDIQNQGANTAYERAMREYEGRQDLHFRNQDSPFRKILSLSELGMQAGSY